MGKTEQKNKNKICENRTQTKIINLTQLSFLTNFYTQKLGSTANPNKKIANPNQTKINYFFS
jgi:hypothetical protein